MHQAMVALVIVERLMPGAAIIPNGHRARAPLKATHEAILRDVLIEMVEQGRALFASPTDNAGRKGGIDVERRLAAAGMGNDNRMDCLGRIFKAAQLHAVALGVVSPFAKGVSRCVMSLQRAQEGLEPG